MTYAQLAGAAHCTVRSVRNYLARAEQIFGFSVKRTRVKGTHNVLVCPVGIPSPSPPAQDLAGWIGRAMLQKLFVADERHRHSRKPPTQPSMHVAFRGLPAFGAHHQQALIAWVRYCEHRPRQAVRLRLARAAGCASEIALWPVGSVLHNLEGFVLVGVPVAADDPRGTQTLNLGWLADAPDAVCALDPAEIGEPSFDLDRLEVNELIDLPFLGRRVGSDVGHKVNVHVRFNPSFVPRVRDRIWHRTQRCVVKTDGSLDVMFGPVDLGAAASWTASFGAALRVLGDKKLRKAVKKRSFVP